jgi:hypothetical protein
MEYPNTAYVLSLIGGIFVILAGLVVAVAGAAITFMIGGLGGLFGLFGIVWGAIIIYSATQLRANPSQHVTWGIMILVFSFVSWIGAFGGFFFGFILALIGGILALVWSPPRQAPAAPMYAPQPPPMPQQQAAALYCPNCGAPLPVGVKFCPNCGKQVS